MEQPTLTCSANIVEVSNSGDVLKKVFHRSITLTLGRDEFREVIMKVDFGKKEAKYKVKEIVTHKKFARDGKATIKLPDQRLQLMLSNCPPDRLIMFLKTLNIKFECLKKKGFISDRRRIKSDIPRSFEEISPLTLKDFHSVRGTKSVSMETPKCKNSKRKRDDSDDKENLPSGKLHVPCRKLIASPSTIIMNPVKLNKDQTAVLEAVKRGRNVFFTGSAGTGKSFLLRRIIGALPPHHTFATASTGVAACHINGTTLHGFAGIGSGRSTLEQCIELASRPQVTQQWKKCNHLIIDEISMVDGEFFDKLETIARVVRKNDSPFGGIQLILCGDFLQLPPVVQKGDEKKKFCFQSRGWRSCIDINMELNEVRRQSDKCFIDILQNIRLGRCPDAMAAVLRGTANHCIEKEGILATKLCTHKDDVNQMNNFHLQKLDGKSRHFVATDSDDIYTSQINKLCPVPHDLELKIGAQVMLAKNLDIQRGLVNGARGVVTSFENGQLGFPIVKFVCGECDVIKPIRWTMKAGGGVYLSRKQIPLKLAWAISVHKSQGMTLDCVEISLSRVFESGQAYVALSRAKSLEGLRVLDFDKKCVRAHPDVLRYYHQLKLKQKMMQTHKDDLSGITKLHW
ncbi:hypothetical protein ScPMuIL_000695 [Solemya velum]